MSRDLSIHKAALNGLALNVEGGKAPTWIELIPAGPSVIGHDGRKWTMADPQAVIAASDPAKRPIALDWEHSGLIRAEQGLEAPAAGWIENLEAREGAIWGQVSWTPKAADQVANREYRFVSPVFTFDGPTGAIKRLAGAGLTNNPNLTLTAMNRAGLNPEPSETALDLPALRIALGLPADASEDAILTAARTSTAANKAIDLQALRTVLGVDAAAGGDVIIASAREAKAANKSGAVDLVAYAPRSELTTAVNRVNELQAQLDQRNQADRDTKIEVALNKAQTDGKITPASRPEYLAMCKVEGGLESFERLAATLPVLASGQRTHVAKTPPEGDGAAGLTAEQLAACKALGQEPTAYAKALKES